MLTTTSLTGRLVGCLCLTLMAFAVSGALGVPPVRGATPNPLALAQRAAEQFWGNAPCAGRITVQWQQDSPPAAIAGTEVEAWVNFQTPGGALDFAAPPSSYSQCTVYVSQIVWPSYASTVQAYPQFCQMMVHEYGHFEGYPDSTTAYPPSDIRYPVLTEANLPVVCRYELDSPVPEPTLPGSSIARVHVGSSHVETRCFEVGCGALIRRAKPRKR